jgi:hypothetical protein
MTPVGWDTDAAKTAGIVHPSARAAILPSEGAAPPEAGAEDRRSRSRDSKKGKKGKDKGTGKGKDKGKKEGKGKGKGGRRKRYNKLIPGKGSRKGRGKKGPG